jgi:hypothetical protein
MKSLGVRTGADHGGCITEYFFLRTEGQPTGPPLDTLHIWGEIALCSSFVRQTCVPCPHTRRWER